MKLRIKKIIAREFLLMTIVLVISVICFLSIYPYNLYKDNQLKKINKLVEQKARLADSLSYRYKVKQQNKSWFFEKFTAKHGLSISQNEEFWNLLDELAKKDSIKSRWKYLEKGPISLKTEGDFRTPEEFKSFFDTNRIEAIDILNNKQSLKVDQEITTLISQKKEIETKKFSFTTQVQFGIKLAIVFGILFFVIRYLFYAIRWSIKILKQKAV
jgi:hypothetical protein